MTSWRNNRDPSEVAHSMALLLVFPGLNSTKGSGWSRIGVSVFPNSLKEEWVFSSRYSISHQDHGMLSFKQWPGPMYWQSKAADIIDNLLFHTKGSLPASKADCKQPWFCPETVFFLFYSVSHLHCFSFMDILHPNKRVRACGRWGSKKHCYHFPHTLTAGKAKAPGISPRFPQHPTRTEAMRLSVDFQASPSTQLYISRDKLFQEQLK